MICAIHQQHFVVLSLNLQVQRLYTWLQLMAWMKTLGTVTYFPFLIHFWNICPLDTVKPGAPTRLNCWETVCVSTNDLRLKQEKSGFTLASDWITRFFSECVKTSNTFCIYDTFTFMYSHNLMASYLFSPSQGRKNIEWTGSVEWLMSWRQTDYCLEKK